MAEFRELFRVLKDASGDGEGLDVAQDGSAATNSKNGLVAVTAIDQSNNGALIQIQSEGAGVPVANQSVMTVKDSSGNLQYITTNADGRIPVTSELPGTPFQDNSIAAAVKGTDVDTAVLSLNTDETYDDIKVVASSAKPVLWRVKTINDATTDELLSFITGPGAYHFNWCFKNYQFDTGSSGTQEIKLTGNQLAGSGSNSDLHGFLSAIELA